MNAWKKYRRINTCVIAASIAAFLFALFERIYVYILMTEGGFADRYLHPSGGDMILLLATLLSFVILISARDRYKAGIPELYRCSLKRRHRAGLMIPSIGYILLHLISKYIIYRISVSMYGV